MTSAPPGGPVITTLVTGASVQAREAAIAAALSSSLSSIRSASASTPAPSPAHRPDTPPRPSTAIILEGLAPGTSPLDALAAADRVHVQIARIAPGCLCCTGNLVLRVTLNRLLRQRPERLFIGVARSEHLDQLRSWLQSAPYDQLLRLSDDLGD